MAFDAATALTLTRFLCGFSLVIQSCEYLALRRSLTALGGRFSPPLVLTLCGIQGLLALTMMFFPQAGAVLASALFVSTLMISVHFRGNFAGGCDSMTLVVLSALAVQSWLPSHPLVAQLCLVYIAAQALLSYVVAGLAKGCRAGWRSGETLCDYLRNSTYGAPARLVRWLDVKPRAFVGAWTVILFELAIVPAVFAPKALIVWLSLGAVFHLANFFALGLNRFVFAWLATYPALYWLSGWIRVS